jgi:2-hydroxy-3-oxopropionate reductase
METAHALDVPIPLSSQVLEYMHALKIDGHGGDDHGGLIQFYETLAKIKVRN